MSYIIWVNLTESITKAFKVKLGFQRIKGEGTVEMKILPVNGSLWSCSLSSNLLSIFPL